MKSLDTPLLLLTYSNDDKSSLDLMSKLAEQDLPGRFFVGAATEPSDVGFGINPPYLTVFNVLDEIIPVYHGPFEAEAVLDFTKRVSSPLIRQFDSSSLVKFLEVSIVPVNLGCL